MTVEHKGDAVIVRILMAVKRRLGRKEVIVPAGFGEEPAAKVQEPLVVAVARAFYWQELLDDGKYGGVGELAKALGVDRRYVGRILGLATLAPELVEAIVAGREASGMSLERLVKKLPLGWAEQAKALASQV